MYQQQPPPGDGKTKQPDEEKDKKDENVEEADFEVVDDDNKDK